MKQCTKCLKYKELTQFTKQSEICNSCKKSVYDKQYRAKNKQKKSEQDKKWREEHKEEMLKYNKEYYKINKQEICERTKQWIRDNPELKKIQNKEGYIKFKDERLEQNRIYYEEHCEEYKIRAKKWKQENQGLVNATLAKRRADIKKATPKWAELEEIKKIYIEARRLTETTGIDHEVDHKIPLNSPIVCGLHCLSNLQILTQEENNRKKCKLMEE